MTEILTSNGAITLGYNIFYAGKESEIDQCTRLHEYTHINQIDDSGIVRFYVRYLREYIANYINNGYDSLKAYLAISFEKEAWEVEGACRRKIKLTTDTTKRT